MKTQCIQEQMVFQQLGRREVVGRFDGRMISSDAGDCCCARWRSGLEFASQIVSEDSRQEEDLIAQQGSHRHVLHLPMALEFCEQSLLSAPAVVEGHDIFVLGGFIGHDDLEVESPLVRDEQIPLEGFLVELSDSVADTHQAVAPLPLLGFPGSLKEGELPSFIDC